MTEELTVSCTTKHRLQIIDVATDFTGKHLSRLHQPATSDPPKRQERRCGTFCYFQPCNRDKTSCLHPSSLVSCSLWVPGVMAVGGGLQVLLASSFSESHPVFVLAQPAHRSSHPLHPLHQIFKAQGTGGMWLKNIRGSASERGASAWYERGEVQVRTLDKGTVICIFFYLLRHFILLFKPETKQSVTIFC